MRFLLNLLWLVLSEFWMILAYIVVGGLWCITIIGIPFGVASFRIGLVALWPFGRTIVTKPGVGIGNLIKCPLTVQIPGPGILWAPDRRIGCGPARFGAESHGSTCPPTGHGDQRPHAERTGAAPEH